MSHSGDCVQCGYSNAPEVSRCVLYIHSCSRALIPHLEWAIAAIVGAHAKLDWTPQDSIPGSSRADLTFSAKAGTSAKLSSELRAFPGVRFEAIQDPLGDFEGERFAFTPGLGLFRASTNAIGEALLTEDRIRAAMAKSLSSEELIVELDLMIGKPWDDELEPLRYAGDNQSSVGLIHDVV